MPFGWFKVAMADELAAGDLILRKYFGTDLVVWRTASGTASCQEAWCPHLGANIGVGGHVDGDCIRCPFHGWGFDASGTNVDIPYADRPNRRSGLRTFPTREHAGIVFAWYHPGGTEPRWEPLPIDEHEDPAFGAYERYDYTVATCLQELGENAFDHAHFEFVHSHPKVGTTEEVRLNGYDRMVLTSQQFPSSRGPVDARIDVYGRGPGCAITRYRGLIDASLVGCSTPIDDETTQLTFLFTLRDADKDERTAKIARAFVRSVTHEVQQDIPIWEAKRYQPNPALAASEKAILDYRRWFSQFYAGD
jgi:phenylpropionate dioxygenase-like ring-hydroxylating dioxygenase large terminal subunit